MEVISVVEYKSDKKDEWNTFLKNAKNPLFLFDRNYMDYHSDRFKDKSLMFYKGELLIGLLPINERDMEFYSHGGLTYGGLIINNKANQIMVNGCFDVLMEYMRANGIKVIHYKPLPHIYHLQPSEEELYSLYANGAQIEEISASTVVNLNNNLKIDRDRKGHINRAQKEGVCIECVSEKQYYDWFIQMENEVLKRHNTRAVHTSDELFMLHERFPDNINLYGAFKDRELIAGVVVYVSDQVVHTQYMATTELARKNGALDLTIFDIIEEYKGLKQWLDFGISTEHGKIYLNEGLISQKEGFGGRTNIYQQWRLVV